jgi:Tfp pilus assembly protein PilF
MKSFATLTGLTLLALSTLGCSSLPTFPNARKKSTSPPQSMAERKQAAVSAFESQRDAAQVQAAISYWQRGDLQKSRAMLTAIIQRSPSDVNARLRFAELLISQEEHAAAEAQLRECLAVAPQSAEAHHALGMLLADFSGREQECQTHLRRAAELEPSNELFVAAAAP